MFDDSHGKVRTVIYQSCYIVLRHLRELLLKYAFKSGQDNDAVAAIVIIDDPELNIAIALLYNSRLQLSSIHGYYSAMQSKPHTFSGKGTTLMGFFSLSGVTVWEFLIRFLRIMSSG